jgi:hypothetical protein
LTNEENSQPGAPNFAQTFYRLYESRWLRIALCVLMMGALLFNALRYRARHGFDAGSHTKYAEVIAEEGRLPNTDEVYAAYNPPLFYLYAALVAKTSVALGDGAKEDAKESDAASSEESTKKKDEERREDKFGAARRFTKTSISLLLGAVVILLMSFSGATLGSRSKTAYLLLAFSTPAFYKYAAMFSPEPFLTLMVWASLLVGLWDFGRKWDIPQAIVAGIFGALAIWTRPFGFAVAGAWGLTLIVALALWKRDGMRWAVKAAIICAICAAAGIALFKFNGDRMGRGLPRPKGSEAVFRLEPLSFYVGFKPVRFFTQPYRNDSPDKLGLNSWYSILYADYWGDYWKFWSMNQRISDEKISKTFWRFALSFQNLVSLLPSILMIGGLVLVTRKALQEGPGEKTAVFVPIGAFALVVFLFFLYTIFTMPAKEYNQVKALYLHLLIPALPFGGAYLVGNWIEKREESMAWAMPYLMGFAAWSFLVLCIYPHSR